jgi:hypothetical protein
LIVPETIFGSMANARRMDSGNAVLKAAVPKALRIVRRSVMVIESFEASIGIATN